MHIYEVHWWYRCPEDQCVFFMGAVLELPGKDVVWCLQESDGLVAPGQPGAAAEEGGDLAGAAGLDITWLPLDVVAEWASL